MGPKGRTLPVVSCLGNEFVWNIELTPTCQAPKDVKRWRYRQNGKDKVWSM